MSSELVIKANVSEDVGFVVINGFVDAHTYEELQDEITDLLDNNPDLANLVLELSNVEYMSSAGIGVVVNFHGELSGRGGALMLVSPQPAVREVFDTFGLSDMLTIFPSIPEAYASIGKSVPGFASGQRAPSTALRRPQPGSRPLPPSLAPLSPPQQPQRPPLPQQPQRPPLPPQQPQRPPLPSSQPQRPPLPSSQPQRPPLPPQQPPLPPRRRGFDF
jgi:anti-anti-sigma factor